MEKVTVKRGACIYALSDPRTGEIRYVGKANHPEQRLQGHLEHARAGRPWYVSRWIRQVLAEGLKPELIILEEIVEGASWQVAEIRWIERCRSIGIELTNTARGGIGGFSPELLERVHAARRGASNSADSRRKTSETLRGVKKSSEHVEAVRRALTGRVNGPLSEATKQKMSQSLKGAKRSPEVCERMSVARRGEKCYNARLTEQNVLDIRSAFANGMSSRKELSAQYGVSYYTIVDIILRRRWTYLP